MPAAQFHAPRFMPYQVFNDHRGALAEIYRASALQELELPEFGQANISVTHEPGTVRGLHFQLAPSGQAKLFTVLAGAVWHVAVDLSAPRFGEVHAMRLEARAGAVATPAHFAHGFQALEPETLVIWFVSHPQDTARARSLSPEDPALRLDWPLPLRRDLLSERDRMGERLSAFRSLLVDCR